MNLLTGASLLALAKSIYYRASIARDDRSRNVQGFSSIPGTTSEITLFSKFQILKQELLICYICTVPLLLLITLKLS